MSTSNNDDNMKDANSSYTTKRSRRFVFFVNPFKWFEMKLKYFALANTVDSNFDEQEFKRGAKQVNKIWNMYEN